MISQYFASRTRGICRNQTPEAYGRGAGVGRGRGVGVALGVGDAIGVGVADAVAVGVGVGLGPPPSKLNLPMRECQPPPWAYWLIWKKAGPSEGPIFCLE